MRSVPGTRCALMVPDTSQPSAPSALASTNCVADRGFFSAPTLPLLLSLTRHAGTPAARASSRTRLIDDCSCCAAVVFRASPRSDASCSIGEGAHHCEGRGAPL